jgi:hypothetical protein
MTKVIGKIVLYEPMDQSKITDLLAGPDTVLFEIERQYALGDVPQTLAAVLPSQFDDVSIDYIEVLKNMIDIATWQHQEDAIVYKCVLDDGTKTFDFSESYVRDSKSTSGTLTSVTTGQVLQAVFTTPGINGTVQTTVELPYGNPLSSGDLLLLRNVGLIIDDIASTGDNLIIETQNVPFKVSFYKPASETSIEYVIDFNLTNTIIEI